MLLMTDKRSKDACLAVLRRVRRCALSLAAVFIALTAAFFAFYTPELKEQLGGEDVALTPSAPDKTEKAGRYNFLIVGCDRISRSTDIMMVVSYDVKGRAISIVQIPRDTYITVDNINSVKINSAYAAYYNRACRANFTDPDMAALQRLAQMIGENMGVRIDYAARLEIDGFVDIVNAVGGVWVDVPCDMKYSDPSQDLYIDLKKGPQLLNGDDAMCFVRFRSGYAMQDLGRQDALKIFMSAMLLQLKESFGVKTVESIARVVKESVLTTVDGADIVYFCKSLLSVDLAEINMLTLPGRPVLTGGTHVYVLYRDDTVAVINEHLNVYGEEFTRADFDKNGVMTSEDDAVKSVYLMPKGTADIKVYTADKVNGGSVYIPQN